MVHVGIEEVQLVLPAVFGAVFVILIGSYVKKKSDIRSKLKQKQKECKKRLEEVSNTLSKNGISKLKQKQILSYTLLELIEKLSRRELSSVEVLKAYQAKALGLNDRLNCLVEPVLEAEELAEASDRRKERGLLEGVPVSIKESYYLKGYESTGGMTTLLGQPAKEDGVIVKVLKKQGAIPFVRTNIPQSMMTFECSNPIYGQTVNPHNVLRGPGGSSGGEGALLAGGGSILGFGSDIGGSIRIPCNMCGVYGLKPTFGRISLKTCEEIVRGQTLIQSTPGPMAKDVDGVVLAMKALLCPYMFELDNEVPPIPFRNEIYESTRPLRIGYYFTDGYLPSIPAYERAMRESIAALEKKGHTLVPFAPPRVEYMFIELFMKITFGDGGKALRDMLSNDETDKTLKLFDFAWRLPYFLQNVLSFLISLYANDKLPGEMTKSMQGVKSVTQWWELADQLKKYKEEFESAWRASELDVVICPAFPIPAIPNDCVNYVVGAVTYTVLYNVINYPAGVVPVTKVTAIDQVQMKDYPDKRGYEKFIKKYFSADTGGLPVGIQCVAPPFQEELALRLMKELDTGMNKN